MLNLMHGHSPGHEAKSQEQSTSSGHDSQHTSAPIAQPLSADARTLPANSRTPKTGVKAASPLEATHSRDLLNPRRGPVVYGMKPFTDTPERSATATVPPIRRLLTIRVAHRLLRPRRGPQSRAEPAFSQWGLPVSSSHHARYWLNHTQP